MQYPIQTFKYWRENAYVNGEPNLELLAASSRQAEQLFFIQSNDTVVVLMSNFPHEVASPDERQMARDHGIYLVATNQLIAEAPPSFVMGWTSDGRGAVYSSGGLCLIPIALHFMDDTGCAYGSVNL